MAELNVLGSAQNQLNLLKTKNYENQMIRSLTYVHRLEPCIRIGDLRLATKFQEHVL